MYDPQQKSAGIVRRRRSRFINWSGVMLYFSPDGVGYFLPTLIVPAVFKILILPQAHRCPKSRRWARPLAYFGVALQRGGLRLINYSGSHKQEGRSPLFFAGRQANGIGWRP